MNTIHEKNFSRIIIIAEKIPIFYDNFVVVSIYISVMRDTSDLIKK